MSGTQAELQVSKDCVKTLLLHLKLELPTAGAKRQMLAEEAKSSAKRPKTKSVIPYKWFADVAQNRIIIADLDEFKSKSVIIRPRWNGWQI